MTHLPYLDCDFFENLLKQYPFAHKAFFMWFAKFKERPECVAFFHPISVHPGNHPSWAEMPGPLQIGIWMEFIMERGGCQWKVDDLFSFDWKQDITEMFQLIHEELSISELKENIVEERAAKLG